MTWKKTADGSTT